MLKIVVGALAVAGATAVLLIQHQALRNVQIENRALQQQLEELTRPSRDSLPADARLASNAPVPQEQFRELLRARGQVALRRQEQAELARLQADNQRLHSNRVDLLLSGKKPSLPEVASYLESKQRSAASLLAAFRATGDRQLLREALEKYPNDPQVNFSAVFKSDSPPERRQRVEALKQAAPDNALANYLSAREYFKAGDSDRALQELQAAAGKPQFQDYSPEFVANIEEAYSAAGCSPVEAKAVAAFTLEMPHLAELRGVGQSLVELATRYRQAGDDASAQAALQMGAALGRRLDEPGPQISAIQDLVGIAIERNVLGAMNPASPYDDAGHTVKDRIEELTRQRQTIKDTLAGNDVLALLRAMPEPDQIAFIDRMKASGEVEAVRWARTRQGKP
jgi:hypothetical protein